MKLKSIVSLAAVAAVALAMSNPSSALPFATGDVFASVGAGKVEVYSPTGVLKQTLNNGLNSAFTAGGVFDTAGNFYVTTFASNVISKWDSNGNLVTLPNGRDA